MRFIGVLVLVVGCWLVGEATYALVQQRWESALALVAGAAFTLYVGQQFVRGQID